MTIKLPEGQKIKVFNSESVAHIMQQTLKRENKLGRAQEHFWVVGLNNVNKILFIELIGLGRQNRVAAKPPDIFRMAIYKLAMQLIMVHNHPSGELKPSKADKALTDRIIKVGEILNVDVLDHLIISEKEYFSFLDDGLMEELRKSDTWRLVEQDEKEIRNMKLEAEKIALVENEKLTIARNLKASGMDNDMIQKVTGLELPDIEKLDASEASS